MTRDEVIALRARLVDPNIHIRTEAYLVNELRTAYDRWPCRPQVTHALACVRASQPLARACEEALAYLQPEGDTALEGGLAIVIEYLREALRLAAETRGKV